MPGENHADSIKKSPVGAREKKKIHDKNRGPIPLGRPHPSFKRPEDQIRLGGGIPKKNRINPLPAGRRKKIQKEWN